jgi:hypothetical protein
MSFDLHLAHFTAGDSAAIDPAPVAAVLARERHTGPDDFGFYCVEFADGTSVELNASGLDGKDSFCGCAFHIHGIGPALVDFVFDIARAGDFVIFNSQGEDSPESPVLILVSPGQETNVPADVVAQYQSRPVCTSGTMLGSLLFHGYDEWQAYRDRIVGG